MSRKALAEPAAGGSGGAIGGLDAEVPSPRPRLLGMLAALGMLALPACSAAPPAPPEPAPTTPTATPPPASTEMVPGTGLTWAEYLDGVVAVLASVHPDGDTVDWDAVAERLNASEVTSESEGYRVAAGLVRLRRGRRGVRMDRRPPR